MVNKDTRRADLTDMWEKTASAITRALDCETPTAASLEVARKFLADNQTTMDKIRGWQKHPLGFDPARLPTFDDTDDYESGDTPAAVNPLRTIAPFAPTDSDSD